VRILFLCHRVPYPPNKGEKIRAFNQLKALSAHHTVDLFTLADRVEDLKHQDALREYCKTVTIARIVPAAARLRALRFLPTASPLTIPYFFSATLQTEVRKALVTRCYDRIFVYCSAMAQYVEIPEARGIPVVVDLVDVDSDKWRQYASYASFPYSSIYRREANRLREYERSVCARASAVVVTTEREARLVRDIYPAAHVHAIPNGVDQEYFNRAMTATASETPTVTFTGDMSYFPNEQAVIFFAREVLPLVRQAIPEVRFLIVGRQPTRKVLRLQSIAGVEVTGFVPDVRPYLAQSQVSVAPFLIAAGIQNKVLEAMSYCLAVVATSRIAESLPPQVAEMVEFGDTPPELASKVVHFLRDPEGCRRAGSEGRRRVSAEYDWTKSLDRLRELIDNPACLNLARIDPEVRAAG
jgi:sugar transferase (PEP-CTERM/EpsH1 system associated)